MDFVPLLNFRADYLIQDNWLAIFDSEFMAAPQGRAIDVAALIRYKSDSNWDVSAGYRLLDGGADNDDVFTFANVQSMLLQFGYQF